ncbi:conserved Plasmodium protein, unknown function [Plasmodium gallinaceum]|uniref:SAP domain-containing protein n=1 Tax=Plasmodium gallinaceum TaxID=5849 RepID=A0A1J1GWW7_PLAGA|nr:conserved Plasmodium protein, unknown function [Plasmodium gallinaceum]CRG96932.1 conserved Plasmodium protein, unknown function [Plasmodium gallinaceum]
MPRYVLFLILFYISPTFINMINKNSGKIRSYFMKIFYISSIEKQNATSYSSFKNVTPIKKKKKQFILLKKKNDNLSINICRLQKKKKNKKIEENLYMINPNNNYQNDINNNKDEISNSNNNIIKNNESSDLKCEYFYSNFPGHYDNGSNFYNKIKKKKKKRKINCNLKKSNEDTENLIINEEKNENNNEKQNKIMEENIYENYNEINDNDNKIDKNSDDLHGNEPNYNDIIEENDNETEKENLVNIVNKYLKDEKLLRDDKKLKNIDKDKMLEEYNRLVQLLKDSREQKLNQLKKNEKKDIYELNERVVNSSSKLNLEKLKKEIEKNFTPNDAMERKIQDYIHLFTQDVDNKYISSNVNSENVNSENVNSENVNSENVNSENVNSENVNSENVNSENVNSENVNSENVNSPYSNNDKNIEKNEYENEEKTEFLSEDEEELNKKILRNVCKGDYTNVDKFNYKLSKKDFEMMKNMDDEKEVNDEEKKLIDEVFNKIQEDKSLFNRINEKEREILKLYEKQKKENKIKRCEDLENIIYYNKKIEEVNKDFKNNNKNENEFINKNIFFNNNDNFVEIKEEDIKEMSESQIKDELRKRGYPIFGSLEVIRNRLRDVMKIKETHKMDIREIIKNPDKNLLSHIKLEKLKETIKEYKERDEYGDIDSKIKQVDSAIEISKFLEDPVHYLRIDTSKKFIKQYENNTQENIYNEPIVNDYSFDEQISMADKLKKTFDFQNGENLPDKIKRYGDENNEIDELTEEKQEMYRKEVLKYGGLQETIYEFHYKHNLSLDFIGDFICKFSDTHIQEINKYRYITKEEMENLEMNQFENLTSNHTINNNIIVHKFVDTNDLIKNYLSTKNIVTLIEYSNIADPVDIIHYYSPETLFMISEEYNITINHVIDACTKLNIKLPYGGDTHLNMNCFNLLTCYLSKYEKRKK